LFKVLGISQPTGNRSVGRGEKLVREMKLELIN
ncbi:unnamed protein product, partial [marine sediment metagenome]